MRASNSAAGPKSISGRPRPKPKTNQVRLPVVISLFSGAGGLDLGFSKQGFKIALAIDVLAAAIRTHKRNFPKTHSLVADLMKLGPDGVLDIVRKHVPEGQSVGLIGGPPCQGFSNANVLSTPDDPRNKLPELYLKIVKALKSRYTVDFVLFENVTGMKYQKHAKKYHALINGLAKLDFKVAEQELCALNFGVPQTRRRIIIAAIRGDETPAEFKPRRRKGLRTVREAISHLEEPIYFDRKLVPSDIPIHPNHWTMQPKSPKFTNPGAFSRSARSFKKLEWDEPSRTLAFGNREIHVHPDGRRRLSIYESMLLQGFPADFVLEGNFSEQVEQISNAVPPPLASSVASAIKRSLSRS